MKYFNPMNYRKNKNGEWVPVKPNYGYEYGCKLIEVAEYLFGICRKAELLINEEFKELNIGFGYNMDSETKSIDIVKSLLSDEQIKFCVKFDLYANSGNNHYIDEKLEDIHRKILFNYNEAEATPLLTSFFKCDNTFKIFNDLKIIASFKDLPKEGDAKNEQEIELREKIKDKYRYKMIEKFKFFEKNDNLSLVNILLTILIYLLDVRTEYESKRKNI